MRNKMDDKYAKEYNKKKEHLRNEQFKKYADQEEWHHNQKDKLKKPKPDPATVEAALRLEEELWAS
jgi:hypothetical protein